MKKPWRIWVKSTQIKPQQSVHIYLWITAASQWKIWWNIQGWGHDVASNNWLNVICSCLLYSYMEISIEKTAWQYGTSLWWSLLELPYQYLIILVKSLQFDWSSTCLQMKFTGTQSSNVVTGLIGAWGHFKKVYELLNPRALKFSPVNKMLSFQCMGKISYPYIERYDFYATLKF